MSKPKPDRPKQRRRTKWGCRDTETAKEFMRPSEVIPYRHTLSCISEAYRDQRSTDSLETYR